MLFARKQHEQVFQPTLDSIEQRIVIRGLTELKEKQIRENKSYDFIDSLIVKICDSESINSKARCNYEPR